MRKSEKRQVPAELIVGPECRLDETVTKAKTPCTGLSFSRINSISDGFFAAAATVLVLNIAIPAMHEGAAGREPGRALLRLAPNYKAFMISFIVIGACWGGHHVFFDLLERHHQVLTWFDPLFLMCAAFISSATGVLREYREAPAAICRYACNIAASSISTVLMLLRGALRAPPPQSIKTLLNLGSNSGYVVLHSGLPCLHNRSLRQHQCRVVLPVDAHVHQHSPRSVLLLDKT